MIQAPGAIRAESTDVPWRLWGVFERSLILDAISDPS